MALYTLVDGKKTPYEGQVFDNPNGAPAPGSTSSPETSSLTGKANAGLQKIAGDYADIPSQFLKGATWGYADNTIPTPPDAGIVHKVAAGAANLTGMGLGLLPVSKGLQVVGMLPKAAGIVGGLIRGAELGGIYGGARKPEEGETRLGNAVNDAKMFAGFEGAGGAIEHLASKLSPTIKGIFEKVQAGQPLTDAEQGLYSKFDYGRSAALGAGAGATEPAEDWQQRLTNIATGAGSFAGAHGISDAVGRAIKPTQAVGDIPEEQQGEPALYPQAPVASDNVGNYLKSPGTGGALDDLEQRTVRQPVIDSEALNPADLAAQRDAQFRQQFPQGLEPGGPEQAMAALPAGPITNALKSSYTPDFQLQGGPVEHVTPDVLSPERQKIAGLIEQKPLDVQGEPVSNPDDLLHDSKYGKIFDGTTMNRDALSDVIANQRDPNLAEQMATGREGKTTKEAVNAPQEISQAPGDRGEHQDGDVAREAVQASTGDSTVNAGPGEKAVDRGDAGKEVKGRVLFTPEQLTEFDKRGIDVSQVPEQYKSSALQQLDFQQKKEAQLASPDYSAQVKAEQDRIANAQKEGATKVQSQSKTEQIKGLQEKIWQTPKNEYVTGKTDYERRMQETAHYRAVGEAVVKNKPVPAEVLADYPNLQPKGVKSELEKKAEVSTKESPISKEADKSIQSAGSKPGLEEGPSVNLGRPDNGDAGRTPPIGAEAKGNENKQTTVSPTRNVLTALIDKKTPTKDASKSVRQVINLRGTHGKDILNDLAKKNMIRFPGGGLAEITKTGREYLAQNPEPLNKVGMARYEKLSKQKKLTDTQTAELERLAPRAKVTTKENINEVQPVRKEASPTENLSPVRGEDVAKGGDSLGEEERRRQEVLSEEGAATTTPDSYGKSNKIFTEEKANAARDILRKKLSQVNSGLDPEMIQAGIDIAGYHIEAGARSFGEFSRKMIDELGEKVKPYLKSWYMAVRYHPGFDNKGMESEAAIEKADVAPLVERRKDSDRRKELAEMSPHELRRELFVDHLTGLGNKRAYEEVSKKPYQAIIDVDSLKWVNDTMNHDRGDELLKAVGKALAAETKYAYHLSGDEFAIHTASKSTLAEIVKRVESRLQDVAISHTLPDGSTITKKGVQFSHGIGETMDEADIALQLHKQEREASGLRGARGEEPPGVERGAGEPAHPDADMLNVALRNVRGSEYGKIAIDGHQKNATWSTYGELAPYLADSGLSREKAIEVLQDATNGKMPPEKNVAQTRLIESAIAHEKNQTIQVYQSVRAKLAEERGSFSRKEIPDGNEKGDNELRGSDTVRQDDLDLWSKEKPRLVERIQTDIQHTFPPDALTLVHTDENARTIAKIFGKDVVTVHNDRPDLFSFNGSMDKTNPSTIILSDGAEYPHLQVIGHELLHLMSKDHFDLYQRFAKDVDAPDYEKYIHEYNQRYGTDMSHGEVAEEFLADYTGTSFTKESFWRKLAAAEPTIFSEVHSIAAGMIRKIKSWSGFAKQPDKFIQDIETAEKALSLSMAEYARRELVKNDGLKQQEILKDLGKSVYSRNDTYPTFVQKMKAALGPLWDKFKNQMIAVYQHVVKTFKDERGLFAPFGGDINDAKGQFTDLTDRKAKVEIDDNGAKWLGPLQESSDSVGFGIKNERDIVNSHAFIKVLSDVVNGDVAFGVGFTPSERVKGQTSSAKGSSQDVAGGANSLSDVVSIKPFLEKGYSGLNVEAQRSVLSSVLGTAKNDQVLNTVVKLIPVDVVDMLRSQELTPEMLFHDPAMLRRAITTNLYPEIPVGVDISGALVRAVALGRAIEESGGIGSDSTRMLENILSAIRTNDSNHVDNNTRLNAKKQDNNTLTTLDALLDHAELFARFPEMGNIPVDLTIDANAKESGSYDSKTGMKIVAPNVQAARSVLWHESQHYLQERGDFARGGNVTEMTDPKTIPFPELRRLEEEMAGIRGQLESKWDDDLARKLGELSGQHNKLTDKGAFEHYRRLAGEEESRRASARSDMTAAERKGTPYDRTDIANPKDLIVKMEGGRADSVAAMSDQIDRLKDRAMDHPEVGKIAKSIGEALHDLTDGFRKTWTPASRGPEAKLTAENIREKNSGRQHLLDQITEHYDLARRLFDKMPDKMEDPEGAKARFIDAIQTGELDKLPADQREIAKSIYRTQDDLLKMVRDRGKLKSTMTTEEREQYNAQNEKEFMNYYFPGIWDKGSQDKAKQIVMERMAKRPLKGSGAFLKQKTIDLYSDGLRAGLKPLYDNPIDMLFHKSSEMAKWVMAKDIYDEMKKTGTMKMIPVDFHGPVGWMKIDDPSATIYGKNDVAGYRVKWTDADGEKQSKIFKPQPLSADDYASMKPAEREDAQWADAKDRADKYAEIVDGETEDARAGLSIVGHLYAPEGAATVLNNMLSTGLRKNAAFRAYMGTANVANQMQLGFSAYHAGFTSAEAMVSQFALGLHYLADRDFGKAAKSFGGVPFAAVTSARLGRQMMQSWDNPSLHPDAVKFTAGGKTYDLNDLYSLGGGRMHMDQIYKTQITRNMQKLISQGNYISAALRAPFAGMEQMARPIMEHLVPWQKAGAFAKLAEMEISKATRAGKDLTHEELRAKMATIVDSIDNRMGQMIYDNTFWNKTAKDLAMASVRSVGWNVGTIREIIGGGQDMAKAVRNLSKGQKAELTTRMAYVVALPVLTGIMGAVGQYLMTGEGPDDVKDLYYPRTGGLDENGRPDRVVLPTYMKDVYHYATEPGKTLSNKLHPLLNYLAEMWQNKDYYGTKIRNEDDPLVVQAMDAVKHLGATMTPFAIRGAIKQSGLGAGPAETIAPFIGITPAPRAINQTAAERKMTEFGADKLPIGGRTQAEQDRFDLRRQIFRAIKTNDPDAPQLIADSTKSGQLSHGDITKIRNSAKNPPEVNHFKALTYDQAQIVFRIASPEEKQILGKYMMEKTRNEMQKKRGINLTE